MGDREGADESPAEAPQRIHLAAWLALAVVVATVVALVVLDLWVLRPPAQRAFITRNVECLRCHADLVPQLARASVHQPFLTTHCTTCHTPHGYERVAVFRPAEAGPQWLRVRLEQLGLRALWDVLVALGLRDAAPGKPGAAALVTESTSTLTSAEGDLCWTCHGNLGPDRLAAFPHAPFAQGHCTSCHDPHASDTRPLLRAETTDLCVSCHRIAPELMANDVHAPFAERRCVDCHEPHAAAHGGLLVEAQPVLCYRCHGDTSAQQGEAVRHQPFAEGTCVSCHRPHSAPFSALLESPEPYLCYRCHPGVSGQFAAVSRHPVPSRLLCSDCHRPHAAPVRGLLPVAQRDLCLGCHTSVKVELTQANVHAAVARGDCTGCHLPHGSSHRPLLQASDPALCRPCHPDIPAARVRGSPPAGRPEPRTPSMVSVVPRTGGPAIGVRPAGLPDPIRSPGPASPAVSSPSHGVRRCGDCHRAHASAYERLLVRRGDDLCARCHAATTPRMSASAHRGLSCDRCHTPHRAKGDPLLKAPGVGVCTGCHGGFTHAGSDHPVGTRYYDYVAKGPLTCASTCHDPHGSRYTRMLRVPYGTSGKGEDYICLICHTQVGITY